MQSRKNLATRRILSAIGMADRARRRGGVESGGQSFETLEPRRLFAYSTIVDLGVLPGGSNSFAESINDSGQVVGYSDTTSGYNHAFLYSNGVMTDLGTLGGYSNSYALGINNSGQIAGDAGNGIGLSDINGVGFIDSNGQITALNLLDSNETSNDAYSINASGQIVGDVDANYDEENHAAIFNGVIPKDLGTLGYLYSSSYGHGINDAGNAVGWVGDQVQGQSGYTNMAYVTAANGGGMTPLGTLGGVESYAYAINDSGQIVGYSDTSTSGDEHAFIYSGGSMSDLDTVGSDYSKALSINASGEAVGYAQPWTGDTATNGGGGSQTVLNIVAVAYENGQVTDLNGLIDPALGWDLESAEAINSTGLIVGYGMINGTTHAYLLDPGSQSSGGSSFAALSGGVLTVNGTSGDDTISLDSNGTSVTATLNGTASQAFALSGITSINVNGAAGNDTITVDGDMPATLGVSVQGGPGDDTITGGAGNDTLGGGQGNDSILGDAGDDSIKGGAGDDVLAGGKGNDTLFGGPGNDLLRGALGDDYLNGGAGTNQMYGGQGNNTFYAANGTGDQLFVGAATNDFLQYTTADSPIIESGIILAGNQTLVG